MVECQLPKLEVAGSIPVTRSIFPQEILNVEFKSHTNVRNVPQILFATSISLSTAESCRYNSSCSFRALPANSHEDLFTK